MVVKQITIGYKNLPRKKKKKFKKKMRVDLMWCEKDIEIIYINVIQCK